MANVLHSGDLGDIVYAMAAMRDLGEPCSVFYCIRPGTKGMSPDRCAAITPLLLSQPYVVKAKFHEGEPISHDCTKWRRHMNSKTTLAVAQAMDMGTPLTGWLRPWLDFDVPDNGRVILHRSPRYHNPDFPWKPLLRCLGKLALFVGPRNEYEAFVAEVGPVDYRETKDLLEVAHLIAGCRLFIGNQSSPFAIAEGLKKDSIQETYEPWHDVVYVRPNAQYVMGPTLELKHPVTNEVHVLYNSEQYFHVLNATGPIRVGKRQFVEPKRTRQVAGIWEGVVTTRRPSEARQLMLRPGTQQLTKARFEEHLEVAACALVA